MANAAGRLAGTLLSGMIFQQYGLIHCLLGSAIMVAFSALIAAKLPD
jgi:predicted MFS family arabinose efflux permease